MRYERFDPVAAEESRLRQQARAAKQKAKRAAKRQRRKARKQQRRQQLKQKPPHPKRSRGKGWCVYKTVEWKRLRYEVLAEQKSTCQLCGASPLDGVRMNVDHIYPLNSHPHLALVKTNLRVLCSSCNWGKGGRNPDDYEGTHCNDDAWDEWAIPWDKFEKL